MTPQEKAQMLLRYIQTRIDVSDYAMDLFPFDSEDFSEVVEIVNAMMKRASVPPEHLGHG